jgi:hypothetical protein
MNIGTVQPSFEKEAVPTAQDGGSCSHQFWLIANFLCPLSISLAVVQIELLV